MYDVVAMRPFLPARDLDASLRFYEDLGFTTARLGEGLARIELGGFGFLLQKFEAEGFADNFMMQLLVRDLDAWWQRIAALDVAAKYGVRPPTPPKLQSWGLVVAFVIDPGGVLWHVVQAPN
jgi:catechol 2,3-dioxygenase-like lactoylglutathione lyase family enzyme